MATPMNVPFGALRLVGRARELQVLDETLARARSGFCRVIVISGEAGVGKSRLVIESKNRFLALGGGWLIQGNCFEVDREYPFAPIYDLLQRALVREVGTNPSHTARVLDELTAEESLASSGGSDRRRVARLLAGYFQELAAHHPLLVIFEDIHWADEATLDLIPSLIRTRRDLPILFIFTYRSDEVDPPLRHVLATLDRGRRGNAESESTSVELELHRLSRGEIDTMIRSAFDQANPVRSDFLDLMESLTEGNPFFLEEVLQALINSGDVYLADGYWQRKAASELKLPRSIHDAVWQRVAGISSAARDVLKIAAVAGRHFNFEVLRNLTGMNEDQLIDSLRELITEQLIREESDDHFAFRHALTRQVVYGELLAREQRRLHGRIADALLSMNVKLSDQQISDLAYHCERAGRWSETLRYATQAGDRASLLFSPRSAVEHYTRALRAADQLLIDPDTALWKKRGSAYATLGRFEQAHQDFEMLLSYARSHHDRTLEWETLLDLGALWAGRDYQQAGAYFQTSLELAREIGNQGAIARSLVQIGNWHVNDERVDEAEEMLQSALLIFETLGDPVGFAEASDLLGVVADIIGDQRMMLERYQHAAGLYRALDDRKGVASVLANIAMTAGGYLLFEAISIANGVSPEEAESMGWGVVRLSREIDWPSGEAYAFSSLAMHYAAHGSYDHALKAGEQALQIATEIEHHEWMTVGHAAQGFIHSSLLDYARAGDCFARAAEPAMASGSRFWQRTATSFLATNRIREGKLDEADALLKDADDQLPMNTIGPRMLWIARARLARVRGAADEALNIVDRLFATARNLDDESDIPILALLRGRILADLERFDESHDTLQRVLFGAHRRGLRSIFWRIQRALGDVHHQAGNREHASQAYAQVRDIVTALGDSIPDTVMRESFLARVETILPPERDARSLLTPRERQVAGLLKQGQSNREIADALFIGERTVETHVGNILAKLGFKSRAELIARHVDERAGDSVW
jgi:predicted ATPase/DNA-binding CsgD family transcriptional regulator